MILRRFTQHIKEQNWFAVGLDILVVIVGIFLGMQVQQWYEERNERAEESDYIVRFHNELEEIRNDMQNQMAYADWVKSHMIATSQALGNKDIELDSEFIVNAYISAHSIGVSTQTDTIDEILSTGSFSKIKDYKFRQELLRFNRVSQQAQLTLSIGSDYQSVYRRAMPVKTIMLLRENCAGAPILNDHGIAVFQVPPSCPADLNSEQILETISSLRNANILPSLREALSILEIKISVIREVYEVAGDSIKKLSQ